MFVYFLPEKNRALLYSRLRLQVYATSEPFEVMALGSAYPAASATPTESGQGSTATGSSTTGSSPTSSSGNGTTLDSGAMGNMLAGGINGMLAVAGSMVAGLVMTMAY